MKSLINYTRERLKETEDRKEDVDVTSVVQDALKEKKLDFSKFISCLDDIKELRKIRHCTVNLTIFKKLLDKNDIDVNNKIIESRDSLIIVLRLFKTIKFTDCIFTFPLDEEFRRVSRYSFLSNQEINGSKKFISCCFKEEVFISGYQKDDASNNTNILFDNDIFESCIFKESVMVEGTKKFQESEEGPKLNRSALIERHEVQKLFIGCEFQKRLGLKSLILFCDLDSFMEGKRPNILDIDNCIFNAPFKLNKLKKIDKILIKDSEFNEKFEFKESEASMFKVDNTNFKKVSDFFKSKFNDFSIKKSIFENFAAFEGCIFGEEGSTKKTAAVFEYVTFKDFSNFRSSKFNLGLDIEKSNFAQPPNFLNANFPRPSNSLDINVPLENSPRETFRLIKHSFDNVGNHIEANKFFALEMSKKRQSVPVCEFNGAVYWLNYWMSDFGQNYWRPLVLLVFLAVITATCLPKTKITKACSEQLSFLDEIACSILPLKPILLSGNEFFSLMIAVLSSILIWQIIISVKRLTRR